MRTCIAIGSPFRSCGGAGGATVAPQLLPSKLVSADIGFPAPMLVVLVQEHPARRSKAWKPPAPCSPHPRQAWAGGRAAAAARATAPQAKAAAAARGGRIGATRARLESSSSSSVCRGTQLRRHTLWQAPRRLRPLHRPTMASSSTINIISRRRRSSTLPTLKETHRRRVQAGAEGGMAAAARRRPHRRAASAPRRPHPQAAPGAAGAAAGAAAAATGQRHQRQ